MNDERSSPGPRQEELKAMATITESPGSMTCLAEAEVRPPRSRRLAPSNRAAASPTDEIGTDSFLFINRNKETAGVRTCSREVSMHVQQTYRAQKVRRQDASSTFKALRDAAAKPMPTPKRGGEIQSWSIGQRRRKRKAFSLVIEGPRPEQRPSEPSPRLSQGNSDPFAALAIPVSPITNRLISWFRDDGLPSLFPFEQAVLGAAAPGAQRNWSGTSICLQSASMVHPLLASMCALMARLTGSDVIRDFGLRLKHKCYLILRAELRAVTPTGGFESWRMMPDMFWAERNTGCEAAADVHLVALAQSLRDKDS